MSAATERDRELFARVAETHPGIVSKLSALIGDPELAQELEPDLERGLGEHLRKLADTLVKRAERIIVESPTV